MRTLPLSAGQRALWFVQKLAPDTPAHNVVHGAWILEELDVPLLRNCYQRILDRHPSLRTTFVEVDREPVQQIHDTAEVNFVWTEASGWSDDRLHEAISAEVFRPFSIEHGPLMRVFLWSRAPREHLILLAFHHLIMDMWSMAIVMYESTYLYNQGRNGGSLDLPTPSAEYADFVQSQMRLIQSPAAERDWEFWRTYLGGELPVLQLPTDLPRPAIQTHRGSTATLRLSARGRDQLKVLGRTRSATLFSTVLAGYLALLHRYTGQEDIVVGTPKANRARAMVGVVGYFVNPVVLRVSLSGRQTFGSLVADVHNSVTKAFQHTEYPFPLLVERLQPARDLSRFPLFQVMFSWQKTVSIVDKTRMTSFALGEDRKELVLNGVRLASLAMREQAVPFDYTLMVAEADNGELALTVEYNTALFTRTTVERSLHHLRTLLGAAVCSPETTIADLPLMEVEEEEKLLCFRTNGIAVNDDSLLAHERIRLQAERTPASIAVRQGALQMTYGELVADATREASRLQAEGIASESVVGFYGTRSLEHVISFLGIQMAGAAYVPLDPSYPGDRLRFMVADAGVRVILAPVHFAAAAGTLGARVLPVTCSGGNGEGLGLPRKQEDKLREATAYVMYTSGSTGLPKGVMVNRGELARHCRVMQEHYGLTSADQVLQFSSLSFDPSIEQILCTLGVGATLVLGGSDLWSPAEFHAQIDAYRLTVVNLPPAYWKQVSAIWQRAPSLVRSTTLRLMIIGGDVFRAESLSLWSEGPLSHVRLLNAYGPTETTITALTQEVSECLGNAKRADKVPIGLPLSGRRAFVADQYGNPVPVGIPGVLFLGGMGLARGYLNNPDLTAERFLPDRWSGIPGERVFNTGDRVRYREDGSLEFLGRTDHQIKIRGLRVELPEIEAVLSRHPAVKEAVTVLREEKSGEPYLASYVVPSAQGVIDQQELRNYLKGKLPAHMLPSAVIVLEEFPRTPGGKVDRRILPIPEDQSLRWGQPFVPPRTPLEITLASEVQQLLRVQRVGVHDNFFDLGGHSLLATQLVSRIRENFHVEVPLRDLFEGPTVADLATAVARALAVMEDRGTVDGLLSELESLSDEAARRLLEQESPNETRDPFRTDLDV